MKFKGLSYRLTIFHENLLMSIYVKMIKRQLSELKG